MLEIYNENLYDLLGKSSATEEKLEVKLLAKGEDVHVPKLTSMDVKSGDQVRSLLSRHLTCWTHSCKVLTDMLTVQKPSRKKIGTVLKIRDKIKSLLPFCLILFCSKFQRSLQSFKTKSQYAISK